MFLSPPEIQHQKLKSRLGSYDREDVDELLDNIASSYEQVWQDRDIARARVAELERKLVDYEDLERLLRDSLVTGQRAAEEVKAEAAKQAEQLVETAQRKADEILSRAQRERDAVRAEITRLHTVEKDVQARCRSLLVGALEAIGTAPSDAPQDSRARPREPAAAG